MTLFLVVRWWVWLAVAILSALMALAAGGLLSGRRPQWSMARRALTAAAVAPLILLLGSIAGALLVLATGQRDEWSDLAAASIAMIGFAAALLAFGTGVVIAFLAERGLSK